MATPDNQRNLGEIQFVSLLFPGPGNEAGGGSGDFKTRLADTLTFEPKDEWLVSVAFASFKTTASGLYAISTSVNALTMVGTKMDDTIAVIPCAVASNDFSWVPTSTIVQWYPIVQPSFTEIEIEISRVDTEQPIPTDTTVPSVVTLAFRRVGAR